jgi:hypothetical protein
VSAMAVAARAVATLPFVSFVSTFLRIASIDAGAAPP